MLKVSVITVCYNSEKTISTTIESVLAQTYPNIEYIIVDGKSTDSTLGIVEKSDPGFEGRLKYISEPDKGIYNAMNKGIRMATGDVIGILNSDDFFSENDIISKIAREFEGNIDAVIADVCFVHPKNLNKITRYYSSKRFKPNKFQWGFMPAHPGFYARKELFEKFGYYKEDYKIAADFELLARFLFKYKISFKYINIPVVAMRTGGVSNKSIRSKVILNQEILRACKENNIITNGFKVYLKYFVKIFEYITIFR